MNNTKLDTQREEASKRILSLPPEDKGLILNCADFYYKKSDFDTALKYFLKSLSFDENNAETYYKTAKCYISNEQLNEGALYLERAVWLDRNNIHYRRELSKIYYKKHDMEKARNSLELLLKIFPDDFWAYSVLGNIYLYSYEDAGKACECYEKSLEINSEYDWGLYNLANIKMLLKDYAAAAELYSRACGISPENNLFRFALAQAYYKNRKADDAIKILSNLVQTDTDNFEALMLAGKIYLSEKKDLILAGEFFEKAKKISPNNPEVYYYSAKVSFFDFDKKNAMINIDYALNLCDDDLYKALKLQIGEMEE